MKYCEAQVMKISTKGIVCILQYLNIIILKFIVNREKNERD